MMGHRRQAPERAPVVTVLCFWGEMRIAHRLQPNQMSAENIGSHKQGLESVGQSKHRKVKNGETRRGSERHIKHSGGVACYRVYAWRVILVRRQLLAGFDSNSDTFRCVGPRDVCYCVLLCSLLSERLLHPCGVIFGVRRFSVDSARGGDFFFRLKLVSV